MTIAEIKAAISAEQGFQLGTLSMVRQFTKRLLKPEDVSVTVRVGEKGKEVEQIVSYDPKAPNIEYLVKTEWVSHWDNDHRVRLTMHEDIMALIVANSAKSDMAIKKTVVEAHGDTASYVRYVVITPRDVEATF